MNYEDRTHLLPPARVLSPAVLRRLAAAQNLTALSLQAADAASAVPVPPQVDEAIRLRVESDTGPEMGAPPEAAALEEDAMVSGYRFGRLVLGPPTSSASTASTSLLDQVESMYLYDLPGAEATPTPVITERHVGQPTGAHEEAVAWAWAFGLGLAAVEAGTEG